ncbi:MAG: type II secretion system ATPase GspE [Simkaniaceae bacterium]|nr:type II secretion system ATPase GspE [Simkaniaceae bacterium]
MTNLKNNALSADMLREYADRYGMIFCDDLSRFPLIQDKIQKIPYALAKEKKILPLEDDHNRLLVAICNPRESDGLDEVRFLTGAVIEEVLTTEETLDKAIEACYRQKENMATDYIQNLKGARSDQIDFGDEQEYDLLAQNEGAKVVKLLNMILLEALQQKASDIHFEPTENGLVVRYRIDGVLQLRHHTPKDMQQQLITRIKVIAKLDIAEHRMPQDGRIKLKRGGKDVDFRVSTVPIVYGERIVLRILDKTNIMLRLDDVAMEESMLKQFRSFIRQNQGIILVTGPTGSGKTTTLYSAIADIQTNDINIMTIEDPVEYKLVQIAQIGVNHKIGLTFAKGLRHILRQDPDVVLIGEIRDRETADIAIQASLTGHLVLSTLHTNDAPSAITRLIDMGIEPYLLSSSLLAVLGQRLIRKICPHCKEAYSPTDEEFLELGLQKDARPFYVGKGCSHCFNVGYQGREAIYELLEVDSYIKQQLLMNPDASHLQRIAVERGMRTMRECGFDKILDGVTTSSEVLRVTRKIK